jgi:hypothetical protein
MTTAIIANRDCTLPVLVGEVAFEWNISLNPEAPRFLALEERRLASRDKLEKQSLHHDNFFDKTFICIHRGDIPKYAIVC